MKTIAVPEEILQVPASRRNLTGVDLALLWFGAAVSMAEILTGGLFAPLGFGMGLAAILAGHLVGNTLFALGGVIGAREGIPSIVSTRPAFGRRGSYLASILNILQLLGWTAVMIIVAARAVNTISTSLFHLDAQSFWVVAIGMAVTWWAYAGSHRWKVINNLAVFLLFVLTLVVTRVVFGSPRVFSAPPSGQLSFGAGLELAVVLPVSWLPLIADYTRFARSTTGAAWGSWLGYFVGSSWMFVVGLAAALATGAADPVPMMLASNLSLVALAVVTLATITTTFMDVYSTAVSTLNIFTKGQEKPLTLLAGVLGTVLALYFPMERYENFLYFLGAMFTPLFAVVLADYFLLRRGRLEHAALFAKAGPYEYWNGINLWALAAWGTGVATYYLALGWNFPVGATLPSVAVSALIYLIRPALWGGRNRGTGYTATQ
ncbi:MAG: putative hydroxymethylpyrimidine transporter CytX [Syntrophothermus sp.]